MNAPLREKAHPQLNPNQSKEPQREKCSRKDRAQRRQTALHRPKHNAQRAAPAAAAPCNGPQAPAEAEDTEGSVIPKEFGKNRGPRKADDGGVQAVHARPKIRLLMHKSAVNKQFQRHFCGKEERKEPFSEELIRRLFAKARPRRFCSDENAVCHNRQEQKGLKIDMCEDVMANDARRVEGRDDEKAAVA